MPKDCWDCKMLDEGDAFNDTFYCDHADAPKTDEGKLISFDADDGCPPWCPENAQKKDLDKDSQRLFDLCRYMRSELHEAGLINAQEYIQLLEDSASLERLHSYDDMKKEIEDLKKDKSDLQDHIKQLKKIILGLRLDDPDAVRSARMLLERAEMYYGMSHAEICQKYNEQACHCCEDFSCGDNTNPEKE